MAKIIHLALKPKLVGAKYWDNAFLNDILSEIDVKSSNRTIFIIPTAYQWDIIPQINKELAKYKKVLVILTSDEECKFDASQLSHPDMVLYSQYNNGGKPFPIGYPPNTRKSLKELGCVDKSIQWSFIGQVNHKRRKETVGVLRTLKNGILKETHGFAQGIKHKSYLDVLNRSKVVPCPSGNVLPTSFRLFETLEAGGVPVADDQSPLRSVRENYWKKMFGDYPFPTFTQSKQLSSLVTFQYDNNAVYAWWINKKHQIKEQLERDLGLPKDEIVAVIPVSPIPSHPDTKIVDETIKSIRHHLDCPILVTIDGVRDEQEDKKADYQEFVKRFLWKCNFEYKDVLPVIFPIHYHQSGMMRVVLNNIDIPMVLYVEQDTPLVTDMPIEWAKLKRHIKSGKANVIRFHFESKIPKPHKYLMIGKPEDGLQKTVQWSQRPHLASIDIYRVIMSLFSDEANCFIEDYIHGVLQDVWREKKMKGWNKWKVFIYHPQGSIKRSYHLDGRNGEKKFDDKQVF